MLGRLVIGVLCFVLGLVLIASGHGIRHRVESEEARPAEVKEQVHWLTAKVQSVEKIYKITHQDRRSGAENNSYEADLSFVTEDGKTIKVHKDLPPVTAYSLRHDTPWTIQYRADDPSQTQEPLPEGLDIHGDRIVKDIKAADTDADKDSSKGDGKPDTTGLTVIGLCLALLGAAMVVASFKSD